MARSRYWIWLGLVAILGGGAAGCGGGSGRPTANPAVTTAVAPAALADQVAGGASCGVAPPPATYEHVVWIFMENHTYGQVIGNTGAPFETALAHQCGTATHYSSVGSPSLPNYIGATSGDTQGVHDDSPPSAHPLTVDNLFRQVRASGRQARGYEEAMPDNCALDAKGDYAVKHNPAAYYTGADDRAACRADDVALGTPTSGALADALDRDTLPAFAFVTPDLCHDTHNCGVDVGDKWLQSWMPTIVGSNAYRTGSTAVFVAWDEYTPMPLVVLSPGTRPGSVDDGPVDHYSLLRTTEELLGIATFLGHAAQAPSMRPAFGL